ncbi:hypothetical protein MKC55_20585 [[Clostridium] innocuum]|nr:hypothetical protein [[Clostridium] innocuum]
MKKQNSLSVYKCNEFRVVSDEFIGRIEDTPENISAFVVTADFNSNYALVDDMDTVKVFTMGNFLDLVPDADYLENELRPVLLQMQFGEIEVPDVKYCDTVEKDLELATDDVYYSMIESDKNLDEIEQDEFDHDDIEN